MRINVAIDPPPCGNRAGAAERTGLARKIIERALKSKGD